MRWWPRRRPAPVRVEVVGAGAGPLRDALGAGGGAGLVAPGEADPDADVVVVAQGDLAPAKLPRQPTRVGWVVAGDEDAWSTDLLEDLDAVLVADRAGAAAVGARSIAPPMVRSGGDAADQLRALLGEHRGRPSVAIVTGVSNLRMRQRWGDHHFGVATAKACVRAGWRARVLCQGELAQHDLGAHDLALLLAGKVDLTPVPRTPTVAWVISHPDRVAVSDLVRLDGVFVASEPFAATLREQGLEARALHQCTDPQRFRPTPGGPPHDLLFVGNSRGVRRRIIQDLPGDVAARHELAVYGYGWSGTLLDPGHLRGDHVQNGELPAYYSAAGIVLNDHWDAMRELAFPSNRLFDAAACGATVVSDHVDGLDELFNGAVVTYHDPEGLAGTIEGLLADPGRRRELGERGRQVVLDRHTFDHRVDTLLASVPR